MTRTLRRAALALFVLAAPVAAQEGGEEAEAKSFDALVEGAEHVPGFFDTYRKGDDLYLVVPADRLGDDFLMESKIARGIGADGLYGGTMLNLFEADLVALEKHGERIFLVKRPHRFRAREDSRAARAVELTFGESVLESAKAETTRDDGAHVIEVSGWFVSDLSGVGERVRRAVSTRPGEPGNANFDAGRSWIESVKGFPDNLNVRAKLTFRPSEAVGSPSVPDGRYLPVSVHYTLARLPEEPMAIRHGDERLGNFWTVHKDFSQEDSIPYVRMVNRWRLEPGERDGDLWRPVEPITYYIDPNVPDEYRDAFKTGVEAWNTAFEAAGFRGAIRALDLPADADPEDIRYPTLRWNTSDQPGYGAIGPSTVDPRTGEVLDADILFESNMFMGFRHTWRTQVAPLTAAEAFQSSLGVGAFESDAAAGAGVEAPDFAAALQGQGALAAAALVARGELDPGDPLPGEILDQFVVWVVMHEVGHTLGLQHNFRSSASTPNDRLHDAAWTAENGVFSSVMEYPNINLSATGEPVGHHYNPGPGSYDRWVISYAYTPDDADAEAIARRVADPRHMFGNESGGPGALDPTINTYDLGADPLAWGAERSALLRRLWTDLPGHVLTDDRPYAELTMAFQALVNQYARAVAPAVKYIGGQYMNRDHVGDPDGRLPFENVPVAEQRAALELLVDRVFDAGSFALSEELLQRMGRNHWGHWGSSTSIDGRLDFPLHEQVLELQASVLEQLLHPWRLARIRDGEVKFGADAVVTIPELMGTLSDAVWSELQGRPSNVPAMRRDLQRAWLDRMTAILVDPPERMPADARAVARMELTRLGERLEGLSVEGLDAYTRAHVAESRARISKALEAGLEAEG